MKNRNPVFVCGFTRGGTNILMNILLSHPDLCKPTGETAQVFLGRREEPLWRVLQRRLCYDLPIRCLTGQNLFNPHNFSPRSNIPRAAMRFIDEVLYREKIWARTIAQNRFKHEGVEYTKAEIAGSRLLSKNVNGVVRLTPILLKMYSKATFFGIVRDGRALCESYTRRGMSAQKAALMYKQVGSAIADYEKTYSPFHIVRFEELIRRPASVLEFVYSKADLSLEKNRAVRLQVKEKTTAEGDRHLDADEDRKVVWYPPEELASHFDPDINEHQVSQLSDYNREEFENRAGETLARLGYA